MATTRFFSQRYGSCIHPVTTIADCAAAATYLNYYVTNPVDDHHHAYSHDPPYCYFEDGQLKFNSDGSNTGACSTGDVCLCANTANTGADGCICENTCVNTRYRNYGSDGMCDDGGEGAEYSFCQRVSLRCTVSYAR